MFREIKPSPNLGKVIKIKAVMAKLRIISPVDHPIKAEPNVSLFPFPLKSEGGLVLLVRSNIRV